MNNQPKVITKFSPEAIIIFKELFDSDTEYDKEEDFSDDGETKLTTRSRYGRQRKPNCLIREVKKDAYLESSDSEPSDPDSDETYVPSSRGAAKRRKNIVVPQKKKRCDNGTNTVITDAVKIRNIIAKNKGVPVRGDDKQLRTKCGIVLLNNSIDLLTKDKTTVNLATVRDSHKIVQHESGMLVLPKTPENESGMLVLPKTPKNEGTILPPTSNTVIIAKKENIVVLPKIKAKNAKKWELKNKEKSSNVKIIDAVTYMKDGEEEQTAGAAPQKFNMSRIEEIIGVRSGYLEDQPGKNDAGRDVNIAQKIAKNFFEVIDENFKKKPNLYYIQSELRAIEKKGERGGGKKVILEEEYWTRPELSIIYNYMMVLIM